MMFNKKTLPVVALALVVVAAVIIGAGQIQGTRVPPGPVVQSPNAGTNGSAPQPAMQAAPALPAAQAPIAASDDFSALGLDQWQSLPSAPAAWRAREGHLQQAGDASGEISNERAVFVLRNATFDNGVLETYVYPTSGEPVGVVFRGSDAGYYRLALYANRPNQASKARLYKVTPGGEQEIASAPVTTWAGYTLSKWQHVSVNAAGDQITVSVDRTQVLSATDSSMSAGWAGVWAVADMGARFDNVRIQRTAGSR